MKRYESGYDMTIIMKADATEKQIALAKKIYPNALVIKENELNSEDNTGAKEYDENSLYLSVYKSIEDTMFNKGFVYNHNLMIYYKDRIINDFEKNHNIKLKYIDFDEDEHYIFFDNSVANDILNEFEYKNKITKIIIFIATIFTSISMWRYPISLIMYVGFVIQFCILRDNSLEIRDLLIDISKQYKDGLENDK